MPYYAKGFWKQAADPTITPASGLASLEPGTINAYYRLCGRPDLPAELVDRMVKSTLNDSCNVTQSSKALHLLSRHSLPPAHLVSLARGLSDHEYNDRGRTLIVNHPRATLTVLADLCWLAGTIPSSDPDEDEGGYWGPEGRWRPAVTVRSLLLAHDARTRRGVAFSDAVRRRNRTRRWLDEDNFSRILRRLWLAGPEATDSAIRMVPTWTGTPDSMITAAAAVTAQPAHLTGP